MPKANREHAFDRYLTVSMEEIEFELRGHHEISWSDFWLNPRRLRGSDFLMRWSQGVWSENRLEDAINGTEDYIAYPYGPSGTAPENDVREFELYFERLDKAGLGNLKRPDLLVFRKDSQVEVEKILEGLGGTTELPFISEDDPGMKALLSLALIGVECENSLWVASKMPHYKKEMKPMKRLGKLPGFPKGAVLPNIIIKEEDRPHLRDWQTQRGVPIHVWHVFFDLAFGISLDRAEEVIGEGLIEGTVQTFQAPGGASSNKVIYKIYYQYGYPLGHSHELPTLEAASITDKNGHVLPYVKFVGGALTLDPAVIEVLNSIA